MKVKYIWDSIGEGLEIEPETTVEQGILEKLMSDFTNFDLKIRGYDDGLRVWREPKRQGAKGDDH